MSRFRRLWPLAALLLFVACLPGTNDLAGTAMANGEVAGFWRGLWHGLVVWLTFFISLFTDDVQVYEVHNNGNWYDAGFFLGLLLSLGGGGGSGARRWRKAKP